MRADDVTTRTPIQPEPSTQEVLAGLVERVTYHNPDNGFCVLRAKARGHRDIVTVVGHSATIAAGEWITASGEWVNERTHGQQFKAKFLRTSMRAAADDVHHRHGQHAGMRPADIAPLRQAGSVSGGFGGRKRHAQQRVGTELLLGVPSRAIIASSIATWSSAS
jgi:hypothetical protein